MKNQINKKKLFTITFCIFILVSIEQGIKLFIYNFILDEVFIIIPHVFTFRTTQNIHLGFIWNLFDFMMPLWGASLISIIGLLVITTMYFYLNHLTLIWGKFQKVNTVAMIFIIAGIICKIIDDIFWGGSLDYIKFFDWFIFDLKDVYITTIGMPLLIFLMIYNDIYLTKFPKNDQKQIEKNLSFKTWVKNIKQ